MTSDKTPIQTPDPAPHIPQVLAVRLTRPRAPLGFTFVIGVILTAIGAGAWLVFRRMGGDEVAWPVRLFSGVFGFFGLLLLWAWFRQVLLARTPPPLVEVSTTHLRPGQTASLALIQPGPAHLKSLRANLVCVEQHITWKERSSASDNSTSTYREVNEKMIHSENLIDAAGVRALAGDTWQEVREFVTPENAKPTVESDHHAILWRIEVWGKAGIFGSFMHPYEIEVLQA